MFTIHMSGKIDISDVTREQAGETANNVLEAIQASQAEQQQLYSQLNTLSGDDDAVAKQKIILEQVARLSTIRETLFQTLEQMYQRLGGRVATTRGVLADQITVAKVMEQQLLEAKRNLDQMAGTQDGKMRMVEVNTYYADKYRAQTGLMQLVIIVSVIFLAVVILMKRDIMPARLGAVLLVGVFIIGVLLIGIRMLDLNARDNMVFDEYSWDGTSPPSYTPDSDGRKGSGRTVETCMNGRCCGSGTRFVPGYSPMGRSYCAPI